jgi:hypothetical protein
LDVSKAATAVDSDAATPAEFQLALQRVIDGQDACRYVKKISWDSGEQKSLKKGNAKQKLAAKQNNRGGENAQTHTQEQLVEKPAPDVDGMDKCLFDSLTPSADRSGIVPDWRLDASIVSKSRGSGRSYPPARAKSRRAGRWKLARQKKHRHVENPARYGDEGKEVSRRQNALRKGNTNDNRKRHPTHCQ